MPPRESTLARPSPLEQDCLRVHLVRVLFGLPLRSLDCSRPTARRVLLFRSSVRAPLASAARTVMRPGLAPPGTSVAASLVVPAPVAWRLSTRASIHALYISRPMHPGSVQTTADDDDPTAATKHTLLLFLPLSG